MNDAFTHPLPDDDIFAHLVAELEDAPDADVVVAEYCRRYPQLSGQLREKAKLMTALGQMKPAAGEDLPKRLGEFQVVRRVTSGGMGDVFEADQTSLGRRVAVKTIRRDRMSAVTQARFMREQTVLASLHQTHIVSIHTAGSEGPLAYFAMPFIEGATLRQLIDSIQLWQASAPSAKTPSLAKMAAQKTTLNAQVEVPTVALPYKSPAAIPSAPKPGPPTRLSQEYFRSVAQVMLDAAEALQHAHELHILHRDMKPSNLMVDTSGQCWIIDFGLAAHVNLATAVPTSMPAAAPAIPAILDRHADSVTGNALLGTPAYMAPEQWDNAKVDARADVWGLGATLYELLTLRRPFPDSSRSELESSIRGKRPPRPRAIVGNVPEDLAAVSAKALEKRPGDRYQTAQAFADDLRRWLNREPPSVRRSVPRRIRLWSARNKGWAAAIALALLALVGVVTAAEIQATAATNRLLDNKRSSLIDGFERKLSGPHLSSKPDSWRNTALGLLHDANNIRSDADLRNQIAAALIGIDGRVAVDYADFDASSVAIDPEGKRLLVGGHNRKGKATAAKLWDLATDQRRESSRTVPGPVAFRAGDGVPLQFVRDSREPSTFVLWDVASDKLVQEFKLPLKSGEKVVDDPLLALTADGAFAAAAVSFSAEGHALFVWNVKTGALVRRTDRDGPMLTALAVDPDGSQIAAGDAGGRLAVWPLPKGDPQTLPTSGRNQVTGLAFGRASDRSGGKPPANRLLAVATSGGGVAVWDLALGIPQAYCRGSNYNVEAVAFSPDGMTLASAGRYYTNLWNSATGELLVTLSNKDNMTGLAFTADGRRLAVSSNNIFGAEGGVQIWDLEMGRGIRTLRGLAAPVARVCISPQTDRLAALADDWQVGIWDLKTGFLDRVLNAPEGITSDNAALEFSPDGRRLVFCSGHSAQLWDLTNGETQKWELPYGVCDCAAFDPTGKNLFVFRVDWDDLTTRRPIARMRNLLGPQPTTAIWEDRFFDNRGLYAQISHGATFVALEGYRGRTEIQAGCKIFKVATHEEQWSFTTPKDAHSTAFRFDQDGKYFALSNDANGADLLELPNCRLIDRLGRLPQQGLCPGAIYGLENQNDSGIGLFRRQDQAPVITLGNNVKASSVRAQFSTDGKLIGWGNKDGTVYVCDIEELRRQLAIFGLNW